jgi:hypothetical protein
MPSLTTNNVHPTLSLSDSGFVLTGKPEQPAREMSFDRYFVARRKPGPC